MTDSRRHCPWQAITIPPLAVGLVSVVFAGTARADDESLFEPPVRIKAAGKYIDTDVGHAAPFVHDIDGDGVDDLLVGQFGEGKLRIYRNAGTNEAPEYETQRFFKAEHEFGTVPSG